LKRHIKFSPIVVSYAVAKIPIDDLTRATSASILKALTGKRAGKLLISKPAR